MTQLHRSMSLFTRAFEYVQVRLVQKTDSGKIYAMKTLQKAEMLKRDQVRLALSPR